MNPKRTDIILFFKKLRDDIITYILGKMGTGFITRDKLGEVLKTQKPRMTIAELGTMPTMKEMDLRLQSLAVHLVREVKEEQVSFEVEQSKKLVKRGESFSSIPDTTLSFLNANSENTESIQSNLIQFIPKERTYIDNNVKDPAA